MTHPSWTRPAGRLGAGLLAVAALLATGLPARAAGPPVPSPQLPAGFLDVPAVPGSQHTGWSESRDLLLTSRGRLTGFPGNVHTARVQAYDSTSDGVPATWSFDYTEQHLNCPATGECTLLVELRGRSEPATVAQDAAGTVHLTGQVRYSSGDGGGYDTGQTPLPAPAVIDLTGTASGWVTPPLTRANADDLSRTRTATTSSILLWRNGAAGRGVASGRVGPISATTGTAGWTRVEHATQDAGTPMGPLRTPAQLKPLLPSRTAAGRIAAGQNAALNVSAPTGELTGTAITTSLGRRLPGNTLRVTTSAVVSLRTVRARQAYGNVQVEARTCARGQAFDDCAPATLPAHELTTVVESIAADGSVVVGARVVFRDGAGRSLGWVPLELTAVPGATAREDSGQYGTRSAGPPVEQGYSTQLAWDGPRVSLKFGGAALTPVSAWSTLSYTRG